MMHPKPRKVVNGLGFKVALNFICKTDLSSQMLVPVLDWYIDYNNLGIQRCWYEYWFL
jgi:hypothetical protein